MAGHVFVSYSRMDQDYADRLVALLRAKGADVWVDHDIDYGTDWGDVIEAQILSCGVMVVIVTPAAKASPWVKREVLTGQEAKKKIMPLLVEGTTWFLLRELQHEDVTDGRDPTDRFIKTVVAATPSTPTPPTTSDSTTTNRPPLGAQSAAARRRREAAADPD